MTTKNRSIALVIEGIGDDPTLTNGVAWYFGRSSIALAQLYQWYGGAGSGQGLVRPPDTVGVQLQPFDVDVTGAAQTFQIHADALAKDLWLNRPLEPDDSLGLFLDKGATTVSLSGFRGWSGADDGTLIWLSDEVIQLGTHSFGSTFLGCTRALYRTQDGYHTPGQNVFLSNPRHVNRAAFVLTYDHDTDTIAQAWQGFVDRFDIDNSILSVQCIDMLAAVSRAKINRSHPKQVYANVATGSEISAARGVIRVNNPAERWAQKRVNKASATESHWMAFQHKGAPIYAQKQSAGDALLTDNTGTTRFGSSPVMGAAKFDFDDDAGTFELLIVDRLRDQAGTADVSYANMRSSSRDLKYPWHPVANAMAILTSTFDPVPGEKGTGAAGTSAFGETITFLQTTQYFNNLTGVEKVGLLRRVPGETFVVAASTELTLDTILTTGNLTYTANNINRASGSWVTDAVVKGHRPIVIGGTNPGVWTASADPTAADLPTEETLTAGGPEAVTSVGVVVTEGLLTIPTDGSAYLNQWTTGGNNQQLSINGNGIAVAEDTGNVFAAVRQSGASISITAKLPSTLQVADWEQPDPGLNAAHYDIAITADESAGVYTTADNSPQAGLVRFDPSDGSVSSQGSGLDTTVAVAVAILEDDGATIIEVNTSDDIGGFTTDLDIADWTIDMLIDPVNTTQIGTNAQVMRDPNDSTVFWLCPGTGTGVSTFIYKIDYLGTILVELDMIDHSSIITTSADDTVYACLDENGDLYVLVEDTNTGEMDWCRFDSDGVFKYSAVDDKGVTDIELNSHSICVGGGGHVFIGNEDPGEIMVWSQT